MLLLLPKKQAQYTCQRIKCVIRKPIKRATYKFKLLVMGLVTSLEYLNIEAPPEVLQAWAVLTSKSHTYTEEDILQLITNVNEKDLYALIVHGIFYYDTDGWKIMDCDDNDLLV